MPSQRSTELAQASRWSLVTRNRDSSILPQWRWVPLAVFRPWHASFYARHKSLVPINQMNRYTGDNSRAKMIPMFVKTFNIGTVKATGLLNRVVRPPHLVPTCLCSQDEEGWEASCVGGHSSETESKVILIGHEIVKLLYPALVYSERFFKLILVVLLCP